VSAPPGQLPDTRIQLCGRFAVRVRGERVEDRMPGRQGRLLFAYLAARPHRVATRDELVEALWPAALPSAPDMALSALISKLRRILGEAALEGRAELRLDLGADAFVDVEAAREGVHASESLVTAGRFWDAFPGAVVSGAITQREFMRGEDAPWIEEVRAELAELWTRATECAIRIYLAAGEVERPAAERLARDLVARSPFRESACCLLMRALAEQGNVAEAILVYEALRMRLRDELGTAPSAAARELHARLLRGEAASAV
jgi:DNA-binding SARP family transcriptional activator